MHYSTLITAALLEECNLVNIPCGSLCGLVGYRTNSNAKSYGSIHNFKLTLDGCVKACGTTKPDCKSVFYDDINGICYFSKFDLKTTAVQQRPTGYKFYDAGCGFAASSCGAICYFFEHTGTTINPADAGKGFAWYDARCLDCPATAVQASKP